MEENKFNPESEQEQIVENSNNQEEVEKADTETQTAETAPKMQSFTLTQREVKEKKKPGFAAGMLLGMVLLFVVLLGASKIYTSVFNGYIVIGGNKSSAVSATDVLSDETVSKLQEIMTYINAYYIDDVDGDKVSDEFYHALVDSLGDKYSTYYNEEEYQELVTDTTGSFYGIGAGLATNDDGYAYIKKVYDDTPAQEAGLQADDIILYVEDIDSSTVELSELVSNIRGEEGTSVHLQIYRPSTEETLEFDVTRRSVTIPSVSYQMLDENIGYVQVSEFQSTTDTQFESAIEDLQKQGMTKMVVDLRGNPGGLVDVVVKMLDYILPEGTVVYTEDKYGNRTDYTSDGDSVLDMPMVVLVDGNSASASEIFAGAIKDFDYGTILGTTTFGKGIVQSIWQLPSGGAIKLTTAKYYTPSGVNIHGIGIDPDVELEYEFLGGENDTYSVDLDNQIQKAIEILKAE